MAAAIAVAEVEAEQGWAEVGVAAAPAVAEVAVPESVAVAEEAVALAVADAHLLAVAAVEPPSETAVHAPVRVPAAVSAPAAADRLEAKRGRLAEVQVAAPAKV